MENFTDEYDPPSFCKSGGYGVGKSYNEISDDAFKSIKYLFCLDYKKH